ncbi:MAG: Do family serine endopeptidase [bacterium]
MRTGHSFAATAFLLVAFAGVGFIVGLTVATNLNFTPDTKAQSGARAVAIELQNMFGEAANSVMPSVVNISAERVVKGRFPFEFPRRWPFEEFFKDVPRERRAPSLGSGLIVDSRGYILTSNHVVDGAERFVVTLHDGTEYKGKKVKLIGKDPRTDLAALKVEANGSLRAAELGSSGDVKVGDWAIAIGNPFGFEGSVTVGVISAKGRSNLLLREGATQQDFLQTDAAINPGNSGGPLLNIDGEVIGINTAISSGTGFSAGVGFAIPIDLAKTVYPQLIQKGKVERGWLGVFIQSLNSDMKEALGVDHGLIINEVIKDGPAEKAGLKAEDVIIEFNGEPIMTVPDLQGSVAVFPVGKVARVKVVRGGRAKTFKVKIGRMPDEVAGGQPVKGEEIEEPASWLGLEVEDSPDGKGVVVVNVTPGSPAADAGITVGDVIRRVGQRDVTNVRDYEKIRRALSREVKPILLWVRNRASNRYRFVAVKPEE